MFGLDNHTVKVTHASLTAENHGKDDHATGMTLTFKGNIPGDMLDAFDKKLRATLFRKQKSGDQQSLEGNNDGLVAVQFPKLSPFGWTEEFPGYSAEIRASGLGLVDPIAMEDVTLKGITFRPLEGGSVELAAKLYFRPDENEIGPLAKLMKEEAELTLTPPSAQ